jgi:hypothetical protein
MKIYRVLAAQHDRNVEEIREYRASCYAEAFGMAERADAGVADFSYGVPADAFDLARREGLAFNEADGLLVDDDGRQARTCEHCARLRPCVNRHGDGGANWTCDPCWNSILADAARQGLDVDADEARS